MDAPRSVAVSHTWIESTGPNVARASRPHKPIWSPWQAGDMPQPRDQAMILHVGSRTFGETLHLLIGLLAVLVFGSLLGWGI